MAEYTNWIFSLIIYFTALTAIISLFSLSGMLTEDERFTTNPDIDAFTANASVNATNPPSTSSFDLTNFISDIIGFYTWGIDLGIGGWMWLIRLFFVYLPLMMLSILVFMFVRGVS